MASQSTLSQTQLGEDTLRRYDTLQQPPGQLPEDGVVSTDGGIAMLFEASVLTFDSNQFPQRGLWTATCP
jgi:hypothetical protein